MWSVIEPTRRLLMKKTPLVVILFVAAILAAYALGGRSAREVHAQAQKARFQCSVPKSYGTAKFISGNLLGFEDSSGTIRWVNITEGCKLEAVVERQ
jgi:hypothetical protein